MEDERMEQNRQPEKTDVVFFSPEMLRLADQHRREQQERLENCRQAARNGDCAAAVQMGLHYFYGTGGVKKDPDKAFAWFSRTEPDDPTALYWLAVCHDNGTGVERDPVRAFELFQESAKLGYLPAVCDLGVCYENGQGTEKDLDRAIQCYRHAAEEGYAQGQCNLGAMYYFGVGVEKDYGQAAGSLPKRRSSNIHGRSSCWVCAMSSATAWSRMPKRRRFCIRRPGRAAALRACVLWACCTTPERAWRRTIAVRRSCFVRQRSWACPERSCSWVTATTTAWGWISRRLRRWSGSVRRRRRAIPTP